MNILLINHYAGSPQHGMEYRPFYLAREWVRAGHQVTILAASFSHVRTQNPTGGHNWEETAIEGVRYLWAKTPGYDGNGFRRALNIFAFVSKLLLNRPDSLGNPDVIIASSTYPLDVFAARKLAQKSKAKVVYEVHDLWPLSLIELGGMSPRHPFVRLMQWGENYAYRNADLVVSMLPKAKDHMLAHGMAEDKFFHIPNGIDPDEWQKDSNPLPNEHEETIKQFRTKGYFLVGYAGAHGIANALDSYVRAGSLFKDDNVALFLVGQGPEKRMLQLLAQRLGADNVIFLPTIPRGAIPAFLQAMDALYIGLQREPLFRFGVSPNKLMDYMMAGKPVIYAIEAGNDPVQESQCGVSVVPEDPAALCDGIRWLRQQPGETRRQMGGRGYNYVTQKHSYKLLAQQFIEIIQSSS